MPIVTASPEAIARAAQALARGEVVAFPTETVYGLGANALDSAAVAKIFAAKARPRFNPLIVHVPGASEAKAHAVVSATAQTLMDAFWPGPLSLVLKRRADSAISDLVSAGLDTIALRAPRHPVARALFDAAKLPIAAPSANRSGRISPTDAAAVEAELGDIPAMILDGGHCELGLESTVLGVEDDDVTLLRPGALARSEIERLLGRKVSRHETTGSPTSPGQLASHYAPATPLRLDVTKPRPGEGLLAFGPHVPDFAESVINLSAKGDLAEAAANFFAALRRLDASGASAIAVMPIPNEGLGEAINDRLRRGAFGQTDATQANCDPPADMP